MGALWGLIPPWVKSALAALVAAILVLEPVTLSER